MAFDAAIADDHRAAVPRAALAVVVAVEEERAAGEIARRPQPEELAEIALRRRLRFGGPDGAYPPAAVARAGPAGIEVDPLSVDRQPARPAAVLRHARIVTEQSRAVADRKRVV